MGAGDYRGAAAVVLIGFGVVVFARFRVTPEWQAEGSADPFARAVGAR
jgi:hypothetical protein